MPKEQQEQLIRRIHEAPAHGHQGIARTTARIQNNYNWPGIREDIQAVIGRCDTCI